MLERRSRQDETQTEQCKEKTDSGVRDRAALLALLWNSLAYNGARWIASGRYHYNIETVLDERIPFIPWTLVIYFGCYLFWGINYILIARQEKESVYRFFTADAISRIVCFCFLSCFRRPIPDRRLWQTDSGIRP